MKRSDWGTIVYNSTRQTGPVSAIKKIAEDLKAKGIHYDLVDLGWFESVETEDLFEMEADPVDDEGG